MMLLIKSFISGFGWKGAATFNSAVIVILGIWLAVMQLENSRLETFNLTLEAKINDPSTGYIARLAQVRTNNISLEGAFADQKKKFADLAARDAEVLRLTRDKLARAQIASRTANRAAATLLARKPQGSTLEARVSDVDARILETLK